MAGTCFATQIVSVMDLQIIVETQRFKQSLRAILTNIYDELMAYDKKRPSAAINIKTMYNYLQFQQTSVLIS